MMQEDQTVSFQPMYESHQPWFAKLFVIYLFIVLMVLLARGFRFVWILLKLRKRNEQSASIFKDVWVDSFAKMASAQRLSHLTVLISILVLALSTADVLWGVRTAKVLNPTYLLPQIGEALRMFALGIIVSIAALAGSMWAHRLLNRRKAAFDRVQ